MQKILLSILMLAGLRGFAQTDCNTVVTDASQEMNVLFINGPLGQQTAMDIPVAANETLTISHIRVTLASELVPEYIHFRFYNSINNVPADPEDPSIVVPGEALFDYTTTTVGEYEVLNFDEDHNHYSRNIHVNLAEPIVLNGNQVDGRFWMSVLSDAPGWGTTSLGGTVIGEFAAARSDNFDWFHYGGLEHLYEFTAECGVLSSADLNAITLNIYPNPAGDVLNISLPGENTIEKTEIYSVTGQKVKEITGDSLIVDTSGLATGLYIIRATSAGNARFNGKFVKK